MREDFIQWLKQFNPSLHEEFTAGGGPDDDWSNSEQSSNRFNGDQYTARGVRSKYGITQMKAMQSETKKSSKRRIDKKK